LLTQNLTTRPEIVKLLKRHCASSNREKQKRVVFPKESEATTLSITKLPHPAHPAFSSYGCPTMQPMEAATPSKAAKQGKPDHTSSRRARMDR
ncbi:hypothetical protein X801_00241, partial [Opisthorchis viverrini]